MAEKFIPDSDSDFAHMARVFSDTIASDPACYHLSTDDAQLITRRVKAFRDALAAAIDVGTRTRITIMQKDEARAKAEEVVRKYGKLIRANDQINHIDKELIRVRERPRRTRRRKCPRQGPHLRYVGSETGVHILEFREEFGAPSRAKPFGAVRLELFIAFLAQGEKVPKSPGERPWYLRSFTTNPIRVEFPMPSSPMKVVYWARWADATGEVSRFSQTVQARVEGWSAATNDAADESERQAA